MTVNRLLRLEGLVLFVGAIALYAVGGGNWLLFVVLLLAPDLGMLGYIVNVRVGALSRPEGTVAVGRVARAHPGRHLLDGVVDHLGAGGAVEAGPAVVETGEAGAMHGSGP